MKEKDKGEFVIPIILIALSIFLFINTSTFQFTTYEKASPRMWPRGILVLLLLTSLTLVGKLLFEKSKGGAEKEKPEPKIKKGMMVKGILVLFLYIFLMQYLGYILATLFFTVAAMLMLGNRSKFQLFVVPILTTAFIFVVFTHTMYIPLPKGVWVFRAFSLMFQ
jgi:hypothetical protein